MPWEPDNCKKVLEIFNDKGVYLVDRDTLTIYYIGKDSQGNQEDGQSEPTKGSVRAIPICDIDGQSLGKGPTSRAQSESTEPSLLLATISPVKNEQGETVGAVQTFEDLEDIARIRDRLQELEKMVLLDPLTLVGNRRYAEIHLQCCLDEMRRYGWPFGILFIDVDYFKSINDKFGHTTGDAVLCLTAKTLVSCLRSSDLVCRWGGEEFVVVLKNMEPDQIGPIAEKLRGIVAQSRVPTDQGPLKVTISVGATVAQKDDSVASLIHRADQLMYDSKQGGRNRTTTDLQTASG